MQQWHAVYTHAKGEQKALFHLIRQGFEAYLPRYAKQRRHARRIDMVSAPLFPRYLFVRVDLDSQPWRPILSTFGVHTIVSGADGPVAISDDIVAGLVARAGDDGVFDIMQSAMEPGDQVRIQGGPMADLEGVFQAELDSDRVLILLKLMGREVRVSVEGGDVEPI